MIHQAHIVTYLAYAAVGAILFGCGASIRFRWMLLRNEAERAAAFKLVGVFVYACFLDHAADAHQFPHTARAITAVFEAIVSGFTACFLGLRVALRWRP